MVETIQFVRGNLPHWLVAERPYFVTLSLHGTLPGSVVRDFIRERTQLAQAVPVAEDAWTVLARRQFARLDKILDSSRNEEGRLANSEVASVVFESLTWLEDSRGWRIYAASVMPTHVHIVMRNVEGRTGELLGDLARFKNFTGRYANTILGRVGSFWAREHFDHWCRNQIKTEGAMRYTIENPVKAGLAEKWQDWRWTRVDSEILGLTGMPS